MPNDQSRQAYNRRKERNLAEFKPVLEAVSNGKCWYSEARDKVSYWEVDHYRPKKLYPWLAFDWRNFRLCGARPNRKKTDEFPLEEEGSRATVAFPDTVREGPILLDPVRWGPRTSYLQGGRGADMRQSSRRLGCPGASVQSVSVLELDSAILCEERRKKWRV